MVGFDAELYLRLRGERGLLSGRHPSPYSDPFLQHARALVAVGAVSAPVAQQVVDDYLRAHILRGAHQYPQPTGMRHPGPLAPAPTIVPCPRTIKQPWGLLRLRYVSFGQSTTEVAITANWSASQSRHRPGQPSRPGPPGIAWPPSLTVTDDRGTSSTGGYSGGSSHSEARGVFTLHPPLASDTRWIEVAGERVDLADRPGDRNVTIETFTDSDVAERYLTQCLIAGSGRPAGDGLIDVLEPLIAAGLLDPAGPAAPTTQTIYDVLSHMWVGMAQPAQGCPEPWASMVARSAQSDGPVGTVPVGAVTPVFDQVSAAIPLLESSATGFRCDLVLLGPADVGNHADFAVDAVTVTFTAYDDRQNFYVGRLGDWSGGPSIVSGTLDFRPALDPKATRLDLVVATHRARAVIHIPLDWESVP